MKEKIPRLVSVKQMKDSLGVTPTTIYNMIKRGDLPPLRKMGRNSRWAEEDLQPFFERFKGATENQIEGGVHG